ncbi:hypothetical protein [Parvibaculum sp.]|uniref:hypothetical protein n=1 Tax=Parvibaculum sp. TaxID=2024848 RepID=UPI002CEF4C78|nr:hypothetical protein [Parvibaculum sp.]HUD50312.1 hypothetical protein [Parvibaculum sp.]
MTGISTAIRPLLLLTFLVLAACATPAKNFAAAPDLEQAVRADTPPFDGKARVLFLAGEVSAFGFEYDMKNAANFLVNSQSVGGINKGEMLVVELAPGSYDFGWDVSMSGDSGVKVIPLHKELKAGEILYLGGKYDTRYGGAFGIVGVLVDPPRAELVVCEGDCRARSQTLKVVVAQK